MDIPDLWRSFYADKSPISYGLREQIPDLWFRIHSLPESKRYAENEEEMREILRRHNQIASEILGENAPCIVFFPGYSIHKFPELFERFERQFFYRFRSEDLRLTMFAAQTSWRNHRFDEILCRVANWEISRVLWMNAESGEIFAPYDGGADLFLSSTERRDDLRACYSDWLSRHPEGV